MICKHCGFKVPEGSEYCDNCGHKLNSVDLMDKLDGFREDDITHAGEQPTKVDIFQERAHDGMGPAKKKTRKPLMQTTVRTSKSSSYKDSQKLVSKIISLIVSIIFFVVALFQILNNIMD